MSAKSKSLLLGLSILTIIGLAGVVAVFLSKGVGSKRLPTEYEVESSLLASTAHSLYLASLINRDNDLGKQDRVEIKTCTDVSKLLTEGLPRGFSLSGDWALLGGFATCRLISPSGMTQSIQVAGSESRSKLSTSSNSVDRSQDSNVGLRAGGVMSCEQYSRVVESMGGSHLEQVAAIAHAHDSGSCK